MNIDLIMFCPHVLPSEIENNWENYWGIEIHKDKSHVNVTGKADLDLNVALGFEQKIFHA